MTVRAWVDESGETRLVGTIVPDPGGGSQTVTLFGPYTVDFASIANPGDVFDLFTPGSANNPAVGDWLYDWWVDSATYVRFTAGANPHNNIIYFGNPLTNPGNDPPDSYIGEIKNDDRPTNAAASVVDVFSRPVAGLFFQTVPIKFIASPVQVAQEAAGVTPFDAGSLDLYLLVVSA